MLSNTVSETPRVIISFSRDGKDAPEAFRTELQEASERVSALLEARGIEVSVVNAANPDSEADAAIAGADGLIVLGGADIDPAVYGQALEADNLYYVDTAADEYEINLVQSATREDKPILGICRGSQILNVALGGTLIQDLGSGLHNQEVVGDTFTDHDVVVTEGSRLGEILGSPRVTVRTGHHQAVDALGSGLRVAAVADDGVVEATEGIDQWILGVQWHPEEAKGDPVALTRLFDGFTEAVAEVTARARTEAP